MDVMCTTFNPLSAEFFRPNKKFGFLAASSSSAPRRIAAAAASAPRVITEKSSSAMEQLDIERGVCIPFRKYTPETVRSKVLESRGAILSLIGRGVKIVWSLGFYWSTLVYDFWVGRDQEVVPFRARQLRNLLCDLGPSFIKAGQVLANRPDIIREDYMNELCILQDDVPPFPNQEAFAIIEEELGQPLEKLFSKISSQTIAAASLGQVYRATLRETGEDVAIKVLRPGIEPIIYRDLFLFRTLASFLNGISLQKLGCNAELIVDEFGEKLLEELDYTLQNKQILIDAVVHAVNEDYVEMANDFTRLGFLASGTDVSPIVPALESIWQNSVGKGLADFNFRSVTGKFNQLVYQFPIRIPERFSLVIRSLLTQEGICFTLEPDFKFLEVAYPYIAKRLLTDPNPALRERLIQVLFKDGVFQWKRLENLIVLAKQNVANMNVNPAVQVKTTQLSRNGKVQKKLDLTDTIKDGAKLFLIDAGIRRQLIMALTEDSKLHIQELVDVYRLVEDEVDVPSVALEFLQDLPAVTREFMLSWTDSVLSDR